MKAHGVSFAAAMPRRRLTLSKQLFVAVTLSIVCGAIFRSAVATRLDGFTLDEAYHIAAGVSYTRDKDFRINPEHPPLVKLWVGSFISTTGFHLSSLRPFADKYDERAFAEQDVYLHNDFRSAGPSRSNLRASRRNHSIVFPSCTIPSWSDWDWCP